MLLGDAVTVPSEGTHVCDIYTMYLHVTPKRVDVTLTLDTYTDMHDMTRRVPVKVPGASQALSCRTARFIRKYILGVVHPLEDWLLGTSRS